jgi:membrane protein
MPDTETAHRSGARGTWHRARDATIAVARRLARAQAPDRAATVGYFGFLAIPAVLLILVGTYGTVASVDDVTRLMDRVGTVAPQEVTAFLSTALERIVSSTSTGPLLIAVGFLLALWTASGAMGALMRALNAIYEVRETRGMLEKRLVALALLGLLLGAIVLVLVLLVGGPLISRWIGGAVGMGSLVGWLWWTLQWPLLITVLLAVFAAVLRLGPNLTRPARLIAPGGIAAVVLWLLASSGFSLYVGLSGSYQRTWGPVASVVVVMVWLWLSGLSLLAGAAVDAEREAHAEPGDAGDGNGPDRVHGPR